MKRMCAHLVVLPQLFRMEGTSVDDLSQPLAQSMVNSDQVIRAFILSES